MYQRNLFRFRRKRDESYGTNFRHAVEFSRSGRAPSRPFQAVQGQPEIRYPVGFARSNTTGTAQIPAFPGLSMLLATSDRGSAGVLRFAPEEPGRGAPVRTPSILVRQLRTVKVAGQ
jgi:hypothetical protein